MPKKQFTHAVVRANGLQPEIVSRQPDLAAAYKVVDQLSRPGRVLTVHQLDGRGLIGPWADRPERMLRRA